MFGQPIRFDVLSPIRILALDLDGTLAVRRNEVSPATRDALTALRDEGSTEIVICSGRRYRGTCRVLDSLGFATYTICNGGALTKDAGGATIDCAYLSPAMLPQIAAIARAEGCALIGQRDSHALGGPDFMIDEALAWNSVTRGYFEEHREFAGSGFLDADENADQFLALGAFGDRMDLNRMAADIGQRYGRDLTAVVVPSVLQQSWYCQITRADVDKWSALRALADGLGVRTASVCAVGDELNDLPMIIGAGVGVAMGDGNPALHAHADWVCGNHDEDGLIEVIRFVKERNGR